MTMPYRKYRPYEKVDLPRSGLARCGGQTSADLMFDRLLVVLVRMAGIKMASCGVRHAGETSVQVSALGKSNPSSSDTALSLLLLTYQ